jgi:predicted anti-sigma-YlaC factor YlaD
MVTRPVVEEGSCIRARRLLSLALDGEAALASVDELARHVGRCERCRRFATEVSAFTHELRSLRIGATRDRQTTSYSKGARQ